jgi:hypothetical protein
MTSAVCLEYALKLLKENPKIDEIIQGTTTIKKHWDEDGSLGVYCEEGTKINLDVFISHPWIIVYSENQEVN